MKLPQLCDVPGGGLCAVGFVLLASAVSCHRPPEVTPGARDHAIAECECADDEPLVAVQEVQWPLTARSLARKRPQPLVATQVDGVFGLLASHRVYFGNLHSHTSYSDGSADPEEAFAHARDEAGLDFLGITEHNHRHAGSQNGRRIAFHNDRYTGPRTDALIPVADAVTVDDEFVALYGQEFSSISKGNHVNVFDVPDVIDDGEVANGEFRDFLDDWLPAHPTPDGQPALLQLNHPWSSSSSNSREYGRDDFGTGAGAFDDWVTTLDPHAQLIEVINGPSHNSGSGLQPSTISDFEFRRYLNLGFHLAPSANQDNHFETWGTITDARTGVLAETLTREGILSALRERHAYASLDRNLRVFATVEDHMCGDIITSPIGDGDELTIEIAIADDDGPADYMVAVLADDADGDGGSMPETVATFGPISGTGDLNAPDVWELPGVEFDSDWDFLYLRVFRDDESSLAWLAPVWFE